MDTDQSTPAAEPKARPSRLMPSKKRLAVFSGLSMLVGAGAYYAGTFYNQNIVPMQAITRQNIANKRSNTTGESPEIGIMDFMNKPGLLAFAGENRMNIMVLGVDYDYTDSDKPYSGHARSDSTMIISLDSKGSLLNVVSIPRDTRVQLSPKLGMDKINAAFSYGGVQQALETVSSFTHTNLDHYVVVNVDAAAKMIDAVGGIDINVEKTMNYDDNWGHLHVHLKKGSQHLTGKQAVGYCRFRHDEESDRGRMRRQQQVIQTLLVKLHDPRIVLKLEKVAKVVKTNVDTDLMMGQILDLARLYSQFDRKKMRTAQLAGNDGWVGDISVIIPDDAVNEKIIRSMLKDTTDVQVADARVEVLNGSGIGGAATQTADLLRKRGFTVVRVADADRDDYASTQIVDHLQNQRVRTHLQSVLTNAELTTPATAPGAPQAADITIIVGKDRSAMASDHQQPELIPSAPARPRVEQVSNPQPHYTRPRSTWHPKPAAAPIPPKPPVEEEQDQQESAPELHVAEPQSVKPENRSSEPLDSQPAPRIEQHSAPRAEPPPAPSESAPTSPSIPPASSDPATGEQT